MRHLIVCAVLVCGMNVTKAANIFALVPTPSFSHQQFYRVFFLELHKRGHNLTVATPNPIHDANVTNYREIDLGYGYDFLRKNLEKAFGSVKLARMSPETYFVFAAKVVELMCEKMLADDNLMSIYKRNEKFDLLIIEWSINYCFLPFEKVSDGKVIGIGSYEMTTLANLNLGNPSNPAYVPDTSLDFTDRMNFFQRVRMTLFYWTTYCFFALLRWHEYSIAKKYFGPDIPSVFDTVQEVALVFDNSFPMTAYPKPRNVNLISLGGPPFHLNGRKPKKLPQVGLQRGSELKKNSRIFPP